MIVFVYYYICLSLVYCHTTGTLLNEDYSNDFPDPRPPVLRPRYKIGSDIVLNCNRTHYKSTKKVIWQFQSCQSSFSGVHCNEKDMYAFELHANWTQIGQKTKQRKLEINNANETNIGIYRCLCNDAILKIYIVDIIGYNGFSSLKFETPPKIKSLSPSNNVTIALNEPLVIRCVVTSVIPPPIYWLKDCNGRICEISNNGYCYCPIRDVNGPNLVYQSGDNLYMSKLRINNTQTTDSGVYTCLVSLSFQIKDFQNVTVRVVDASRSSEQLQNLFPLLFFTSLAFILIPVLVLVWAIWICHYRRKNRDLRIYEQKQLIKRLQQEQINIS